MDLGWLFERMAASEPRGEVIWNDRVTSHTQLLGHVARWRARIASSEFEGAGVVAVEGDFTPEAIALILALIEADRVVIPLTHQAALAKSTLCRISEAQSYLAIDDEGRDCHERLAVTPCNPVLTELLTRGEAGVVIFSSGTTGEPKAVLHSAQRLLERYRTQPRPVRMLTFLLFDHIGGLNSLFYALASGGAVVSLANRDPESVCMAIERHRVEVLPTSPTFLNLLLLSGAAQRHDLSALRKVQYGTEVMPATTLARLREAMPRVEFQQTYGLSEMSILRSRSRDDGSLWVRLGGDGYETEVRDGVLWIRGRSAMLGYLNAESPFDSEGWLNTGDAVAVDGDYIRILGRRTEMINVGGEKLHPAEVESVLLNLPNIVDVAVRGVSNPISGQAVVARVYLAEPEERSHLLKRMRAYCRDRLAPYKVPVRVEISCHPLHSNRFKKRRLNDSAGGDRKQHGE